MNTEQFGAKMIELLPQLIRGLAQYEHNYLSRGKITLPQLWVLEYLSRQGSSPMNHLARFLKVSRPATTGLVDRLILQGLVKREEDKSDRRVVRVTVTPKGRKIIANIWEQKRRTFVRAFGQISPQDRAQYITTLEQVASNLTQRQPVP